MSSSRSKCGLLRELNYNYNCKGCERDITLVKKDTFRSKPLVNISDNMIRVTVDMPILTWYRVKKELGIKE